MSRISRVLAGEIRPKFSSPSAARWQETFTELRRAPAMTEIPEEELLKMRKRISDQLDGLGERLASTRELMLVVAQKKVALEGVVRARSPHGSPKSSPASSPQSSPASGKASPKSESSPPSPKTSPKSPEGADSPPEDTAKQDHAAVDTETSRQHRADVLAKSSTSPAKTDALRAATAGEKRLEQERYAYQKVCREMLGLEQKQAREQQEELALMERIREIDVEIEDLTSEKPTVKELLPESLRLMLERDEREGKH